MRHYTGGAPSPPTALQYSRVSETWSAGQEAALDGQSLITEDVSALTGVVDATAEVSAASVEAAAELGAQLRQGQIELEAQLLALR